MRISQLWTVALLSGLLALPIAAPAGADQLTASCAARDEKGGEKIVCQLRSVTGESLSDIKATDDTGRALELTAEPYSWTRNRTGLYFLVQTADLNADQLRRVAQFLERAASPVGERQIGIGTVDYAFSERASLGAYRLQVEREVQAIANASPTRAYPEMTEHMRTAIDKLAGIKADRRALVLVSDGASSASAQTERDIADHARSKGVLVYNFVLAKSDRPQASVLSRIAEKTDGAARDLSTASNADVVKLATDLFNLVENGSVVQITAVGLPQETEITLKATSSDRQVSAAPIPVTRLTEDSLRVRLTSWIERNILVVVAGLGLLIGLVMILGSMLRARRASEAEAMTAGPDSEPGEATDPNAPTEIVLKGAPPAATPLGWLELMGTDGGARMPLHVGSVHIGRHRENEICLLNNSVHRRHAILHVAEDGVVSIHDLATKNGVAVNGARVSQKNLANGDVIELGEVKLKFTTSATAADAGSRASA